MMNYSYRQSDGTETKTDPTGKVLIFVFVAVVFAAGIACGGFARFLYRMSQTLPPPALLQNIQPSLVSNVYGADGSRIHEFSVERRFWVPIEQIPQDMLNAVVAIEDRRFYSHWGIDIHRILGAAVANLLKGGIAQGGSTLTQQLARNIYLTHRQSMSRKIREAMTAVQIERYYTKTQILELYLNQVYLGAGVYGIEAASQQYFSKPAAHLTLNECAVLAGCIQLPERYRPDKQENIKRITTRRNTVLRAMTETGYIKKKTAREIITTVVPANPRKNTSKIAPYFLEVVRQHLEQKYGEQILYSGGLKIYTTLDPYAQDTAEKSLAVQLRMLQRHTNRIFLDSTRAHKKAGVTGEFFMSHFDSMYALHRVEYDALPDSVRLRIVQGAVIALDNRTGAVRLLIGGRNFSESKFNRALQARRQPGSAFKPFVYAAAIDSGYTPVTKVLDQAISLETPEGIWRPENYDREFLGHVCIREAVKKSLNIVAIQVLMDVGAEKVVEYARLMGLKQSMNPVPSLAIGACQAIPVELASAYSIFANGGRRASPYFIEKIVDKNGRILEQHRDTVAAILSPKTAFLMTSLLQSVVTSGTAAAIPGLGFTRPAAGKTGTTNAYSDAWFVGYTPQVTCAVWVGIDERRGMGSGVTGSYGAVPVWVPSMVALHQSLPVEYFHQPEGIVSRTVCKESRLLAREQCRETYTEFFMEGILPDSCDLHGLTRASKTGSVLERFGSSETRKPVNTKPGRRKTF
jgi:penicillin-binding protein 1A